MGSPRSGTSLLCNLLDRTDVAGRPNEYLWRDDVGRLWKDWRVGDERSYLTKVLELGTTDNGVFGIKLMWTYLDEACDFLRRTTGPPDVDDAKILQIAFPRPRFIWVWRNDAVAQAVSWARAEQTGEWYSGDPRRSAAAPRFDFAQVDNLVSVATRLNAVGMRWFGRHRIRPFIVCHEDLVDVMEATVRAVLRFLRIPFPRNRKIRPSLRLQADALNAEWQSEYRAQARTLPQSSPLTIDLLPSEADS